MIIKFPSVLSVQTLSIEMAYIHIDYLTAQFVACACKQTNKQTKTHLPFLLVALTALKMCSLAEKLLDTSSVLADYQNCLGRDE